MRYDPRAGRYVADAGQRRAVLSLSPQLQREMEKLLVDERVPMGAVVVMEPRTGRVLALAERGGQGNVALRPVAPAASIFKIVTGAALLERGVRPESEVCYHGGRHRIQKALLTDDPRRDHRCLTLEAALAKSANVVFAKLAERDLSAELLQAEANRFLFNETIPFEWPVVPSPASISSDPFEFATTAAGFGPVRLSPLHGALLASIVANRGVLVMPRIVDEIDGVPAPSVGASRRVVRPQVAAALARMMQATVTDGTARKFFRRDRLDRHSVAGKTGSLSEPEPFRDYSWFVGFAPVEAPQVAVAVVVVNERLWHVKAPLIAREALRSYFAMRLEREPTRVAAK
jgi:cell division protein FtsI/penicillin-binding protein 2